MDLKLRVILDAVDRLTRPLKATTATTRAAGKALAKARERKQQLDRTMADVEAFRRNRHALDETRTALQAAGERTQQLGRDLHTATRPTRAMTREFNRARRELHALQAREREQASSLQGLRGRLAEAGVATQKLGTHERRLRGEADAATRAVERQTERLRKLGNIERRMSAARERMNRLRSRGSALMGAGMSAAFAGGGALFGMGRLLAPGVQFQAAESRVKAIAQLKDGSRMAKALHDQAEQLGANTVFTATDAARGQAFLAMAGFTPNSIRAAMPGMLNLAMAGSTDGTPMALGETADIASNVLTGMNLKATQMNRVADVLARTTTRSNTDLRMLGEAMSYVAPQSAALHVSLETTAAMVGKLGDAGIQASQSGTILRAMLTRLAAPPAAAAKALRELNVQTHDAHGNMRSIPAILSDIHRATAGMGTGQRAAYLAAIAGQRAVAGMTQLVRVAGNGSLQTLIATLQHSSGTAAHIAHRMVDNAQGDLKALGSAWQELGIKMFEDKNAPIRGLIQHVTHLVRGLTAWIVANPKLASTLATIAAVLATVLAVAGALVATVGMLLGPFAMAKFGMETLGIKASMLLTPLKLLGSGFLWLGKSALRAGAMLLANPIILVVVAIVAALAFAAYEIHKHWAAIKTFFVGLWQHVVSLFRGAGPAILSAIMPAIGLPLLIFKHWGAVKGFFASMWKHVTATFAAGVRWVMAKLEPLRHALHWLSGAWDRLVGKSAPMPPSVHRIKWITANDVQAQREAMLALTGRAAPSAGYRPLSRRSSVVVHRQGDQITIDVHGHHDPHATARAVREELDRRDREHAAAQRSALHDYAID